MSDFLRNEQCPECKRRGKDTSRDNLGVWTNHKRCWSCGYYEKTGENLDLNRIRNKNNNNKNKEPDGIHLPYDFTTDIPDEALDWLFSYDITMEEVYGYKLGWSDTEQRLYFPVYDALGNLLILQGRYYGHDPKQPRYRTHGKSRDLLTILPQRILSPETGVVRIGAIICCEDYVSAMKIARFCNSWCLFGSQISHAALFRAAKTFSRLGIWLDRDKAKYALESRLGAFLWFDGVFTIITEKDPKCYSDKEIEAYIRG